MKTTLSRTEELAAKHAKEIAEAKIEDSILAMLPDTVKLPTVSNIRETPDAKKWTAWLSFSAPAYDPDETWNPVQQLRDLEAAGWRALPASLVKKDNYRPAPEIGACDSFEETLGRYRVTFAEPIAPLWITPQQYTPCDVNFYLAAPDGRFFRCSMDVPGLAHLTARRIAPGFGRDWYFMRGTARVIHPESWLVLHEVELERSTRSGAQVDTKQGISGQIYFTPQAHEQENYPYTLSQILEALMA